MRASTINKQCQQGSIGTVRGAKPRNIPLSHARRRRLAVLAHPVVPADGLAEQVHVSATIALKSGMLAAKATAAAPESAERSARAVPRVLHIDSDSGTALVLASLLMPEARVTHVATLAEARRLLKTELFSLVVLDPRLSDGDGGSLLPALVSTPLLVYSANQPEWRDMVRAFLPKPWTSPRQLWSTVATLLGIVPGMSAGD